MHHLFALCSSRLYISSDGQPTSFCGHAHPTVITLPEPHPKTLNLQPDKPLRSLLHCRIKLRATNTKTLLRESYVYWTVHRLDSWIKIDQLDVICFIISIFIDQHVSNVSTSNFRSLRIIVDFFHVLYCSGSMCIGVTVWFGWGGVVSLCRLQPA